MLTPTIPLVLLHAGAVVALAQQRRVSADTARKAIEQRIGKTLQKCSNGEGMRTCALEVGERKTLMLMADASGKSKTTLVGCYYYYEK
jgi:hypothetical protein